MSNKVKSSNEDENEENFDKLEEKFKKACLKVEKESVKVKELLDQAEALAIEIAEKHGIPVSFGEGEYLPESISKWTDEKKLSPEEIDYMTQRLIDSFISVADEDRSEPGSMWMPSRFC